MVPRLTYLDVADIVHEQKEVSTNGNSLLIQVRLFWQKCKKLLIGKKQLCRALRALKKEKSESILKKFPVSVRNLMSPVATLFLVEAGWSAAMAANAHMLNPLYPLLKQLHEDLVVCYR